MENKFFEKITWNYPVLTQTLYFICRKPSLYFGKITSTYSKNFLCSLGICWNSNSESSPLQQGEYVRHLSAWPSAQGQYRECSNDTGLRRTPCRLNRDYCIEIVQDNVHGCYWIWTCKHSQIHCNRYTAYEIEMTYSCLEHNAFLSERITKLRENWCIPSGVKRL